LVFLAPDQVASFDTHLEELDDSGWTPLFIHSILIPAFGRNLFGIDSLNPRTIGFQRQLILYCGITLAEELCIESQGEFIVLFFSIPLENLKIIVSFEPFTVYIS